MTDRRPPPRPAAYSGGRARCVPEPPAPRGASAVGAAWTRPFPPPPAAAMAAAAAPRSLLVLLQVLGLALAQIVSPTATPRRSGVRGLGCDVQGLPPPFSRHSPA